MDVDVDDMTRSCAHLSQCVVQHVIKHVRCAREKVTCEVCCPHLPSVFSRLLSAVNETCCNKQSQKKIELMSSTSFWTCPNSTRSRFREKGAISDIVAEV